MVVIITVYLCIHNTLYMYDQEMGKTILLVTV